MSKQSRRPTRRHVAHRGANDPARRSERSPEDEFLNGLGTLHDPYLNGLRIAGPMVDVLVGQGRPDIEIARFLVYAGTFGLDALTADDDPDASLFFASPSCGSETCLTPAHQVVTTDEARALSWPPES